MTYVGPAIYKPVARWVPCSDGNFPPNSFKAGMQEDKVAYVARANYLGETITGKLIPEEKSCYIAWGQQEYACNQYEVLVATDGAPLEWRRTYGNNIPSGAVHGGRTNEGEMLFIGRVYHGRVVCCGSVYPNQGLLKFSFEGREYLIGVYEILVCRSANF